MPKKKEDLNRGGPLQMSFFTPETDWKVPTMADLPSWSGAKRIAIDSETHDQSLNENLGNGSLRGGYTVGWAFAIDEGPSYYLPMRHEGGDNLPISCVLGYLREQVKNFTGEYVGANLAYDIDYGLNDGFQYHPEAKFRDVQIADPLIYELHFSYSLKAIGERYGVQSKDEALLEQAAQSLGLHPKRGLWRLPGTMVGAYAEQDVRSPLEILKKQEQILSEKNLLQVWELESQVLPVLVKMRRRGVLVNLDKLEQIEQWSEAQEKLELEYIKRETGVDIGFGNLMAPSAVAPALKAAGIHLNTTSTGAPQIDRFLLKKSNNAIANAVLRGRKVNKIRTTFAASIRKYIVNGRIHCTFHQIAREDESGDQRGVRYGRLSATDPNLQQQPSPERDKEIAGEWRKIFEPEPESVWGTNDYSQQEPRWTTHFAALMDLPRAREAADRYCRDPSTDNHDMMTRLIYGDVAVDRWDPSVYKVNRGYSKNIFLGLCYGEGGTKLCGDIGKPTRWAHISGWGDRRTIRHFLTKHDAMAYRMEVGNGYIREVAGEEGQEILDKFNKEVPYVSDLAEIATNRAKQNGYVKTVSGRRLHFEQRDDGTYEFAHKALNRIIQGSSADQTKKALVEINRAGYFLQLQVHDETGGSYENYDQAKQVGMIMSECILEYCKPLVPFKVDTEVGPSWGEAR